MLSEVQAGDRDAGEDIDVRNLLDGLGVVVHELGAREGGAKGDLAAVDVGDVDKAGVAEVEEVKQFAYPKESLLIRSRGH